MTVYREWRTATLYGCTVYLSDHPGNDKYGASPVVVEPSPYIMAAPPPPSLRRSSPLRDWLIGRFKELGGRATIRELGEGKDRKELTNLAKCLMTYPYLFRRTEETKQYGIHKARVWELK